MKKGYLLLFGMLFLMLFVAPNDLNYDQVSDLKFKPFLSSSEDDYYFDWN